MQRSGITFLRSLDHYFNSDTGTLSKSPSRSKTILIQIGPRKRPVGRPRRAAPAVMASVMAASPKLVDYSSTDSESSSAGPSTDCPSTKKRIQNKLATCHSNYNAPLQYSAKVV